MELTFQVAIFSSVAFANVISIPIGNVHDHITLNDGLATEARVKLEIGGLFNPVQFVVIHLGKIVLPGLHHHMTGCARAASAAGVFEVETEIHGHVEK
jgi:hypothetical protein